MGASTSLSRMRLVSKLCKRGAWLITVIGCAIIVFFLISNISNNQANPGQNPNDFLITFAFALAMAIPIIFFFLILYAVGAFLDYMSTERDVIEKNIQEEYDERVEITPISELR